MSTTDTPLRRGLPPDGVPTSHRPARPSRRVAIPQYSRRSILAIWAAATVPMGLLAWVGAPALASSFEGSFALGRALIVCLAAGLVWQGVLVAVLVWREQRSLRWSTLREALWLRAPRNPKTGRTGGRVWLVVVPLILALALTELLPGLPIPSDRDLGGLLESDAGRTLMSGAWGWLAVMLVSSVFNTVLGEELLFRGFLLPRMNGAFGERDWVANGVLFAAYHVHVPWVIPVALLDTLILAHPTKRYRSAWIGIAVHSAQSVVVMALVLSLVVS